MMNDKEIARELVSVAKDLTADGASEIDALMKEAERHYDNSVAKIEAEFDSEKKMTLDRYWKSFNDTVDALHAYKRDQSRRNEYNLFSKLEAWLPLSSISNRVEASLDVSTGKSLLKRAWGLLRK